MDIITRNLFRLLRAGALGEYEEMEPMSPFKWRRLFQIVRVQDVADCTLKGIDAHREDVMMNIPTGLAEELPPQRYAPNVKLSNGFLNRRLQRIEWAERHSIDTNVGALDVLGIIVSNAHDMLNRGTMLGGIIQLGGYLRKRGDQVDFVKLEAWLAKLHIRRMAQLQGSMLVSVFRFEPDELPFVSRLEPAAYKLVMRSVGHIASDTAEEWHFKQGRTGFVSNNSALLRRNLRRSLRYVVYAPIETISNYCNNFAKSLQEIEE